MLCALVAAVAGCTQPPNETAGPQVSPRCLDEPASSVPLAFDQQESFEPSETEMGVTINEGLLASGRLEFSVYSGPYSNAAHRSMSVGEHGAHREPGTNTVRAHIEIHSTDAYATGQANGRLNVTLREPLESGTYVLRVCIDNSSGNLPKVYGEPRAFVHDFAIPAS